MPPCRLALEALPSLLAKAPLFLLPRWTSRRKSRLLLVLLRRLLLEAPQGGALETPKLMSLMSGMGCCPSGQ